MEEYARRRRLLTYAVLGLVLVSTLALVAFRVRPNRAPEEVVVTAIASVLAADAHVVDVTFADPNGDDYVVTFEIGDGKASEVDDVVDLGGGRWSTNLSVSWDVPGRYWVQATVSDRRGGIATSTPVTVAVGAVAPPEPNPTNQSVEVAYAEFTASETEVTVGENVTFTATASGEWTWTVPNGSAGEWVLRRDLSGVIDVWGWDFGDGESLQRPDATGATVVHRFAEPGLHFVRLTARHAAGTVASWGVTIRVT